MEIEVLRAYCAVYEQGALARAAKKLGISTPMMTRRIQQLETELEVTLLMRSTRAMTPTEAGDMFYQQAKSIIQQYDASVCAVQGMTDHVSGVIKIGLPASINQLWVAPQLCDFQQQYPDVQLHLANGNHLLGMLSEGFDIVIHCSHLPDSGLFYKKIRQWTKITCASPEYLDKRGVPKHPNELVHHNCLDHYDNRSHGWKYKIDDKPTLCYVDGSVRANSSLDLRNLALSGLGVVYLPSFAVADAIASGGLLPVLAEYQAASYDMYAVFSAKPHSNKKIQIMLDYLDQVLP